MWQQCPEGISIKISERKMNGKSAVKMFESRC